MIALDYSSLIKVSIAFSGVLWYNYSNVDLMELVIYYA